MMWLTDGQTDRRTDGRTDEQTDGRTPYHNTSEVLLRAYKNRYVYESGDIDINNRNMFIFNLTL